MTPEYIDEKTLKPFDGGLASYLNKITRILVRLGHNINVIVINARENKKIDYLGIRVIFVQSKFKKTFFQKLLWPFFNKRTRKNLKFEPVYAKIHKILNEEQSKETIDIIQYASFSATGKYPEKKYPFLCANFILCKIMAKIL